MKIAGLILAAGESSRMGYPKALLRFRGETFLDALIRALGEFCSPVIAVLGGDSERIRANLRRTSEATLVVNPEYKLGQICSMQCGLRAVPQDCDGVLFTLVDHPRVQPSTLRALTRPAEGPVPLRVPRHEGRRGHPVLIGRELIPEFLAPGITARDVVNRHSGQIEYVDVDDPGILTDVDTPEAYRALTGEARE